MAVARRSIPSGHADGDASSLMMEIELELAELRKRRQSGGFFAWVRSLRPFDRRAIREPDDRDIYWVNVQRRLAESEPAFLTRHSQHDSADSRHL